MPTKIINNKPYAITDYLRKLNKYRFLIKVLAIRELKIKYSKTLLGVGWLFAQPLLLVVVYSIFFKHIIKIHTGEIPYALFVFSGLVLWYIFTGVVSKCTYALLESSDLINKVSFPRFIILVSKIIPVLLECLILLVMLFVAVLLSNQSIGLNAACAFFYFLQISMFSFAIGMLCSIITLKFRDTAHIIPFVINFGIWLTPVFYSVSTVPTAYQNLFKYLNPLTLSLEGLRDSIFFNKGIAIESFILFFISVLLFSLSFIFFVKFEKKIVENL